MALVFTFMLCKYFPFIFYSNVSVSSYCLCLISINRALAIWNQRLALKIFTWKKCFIFYIFLWLVSFTYWLFPMFKVWGEITYEPSTFSCTATKFEDPNQWGSPLIIFAIIGFMLRKIKWKLIHYVQHFYTFYQSRLLFLYSFTWISCIYLAK